MTDAKGQGKSVEELFPCPFFTGAETGQCKSNGSLYAARHLWKEAAKVAEAARAGYTLMTTTAEYEGFNNISNKEWIWGFPQIPSQSDATNNFYYMDPTYVGANSSFSA